MGTVSDPRSLMVLPDDVLLLTLSFMPGQKRVKLSRACKRMSCVVDQSLAGVKELDYDKWFGFKLDKYKTKVFSKFINLRVFCTTVWSKQFSERIARVLAKNCPNLIDMRCHTRISQPYAKEMHKTGSLNLEVIRLTGREWDIQFVKQLLQSYPNIRVKALHMDGMDNFLHHLGDAVEVIKSRTTDFVIGDVYKDLMQSLTLILTWSTNIRVLDVGKRLDRQTLQSILNSLPKLQELKVTMDIRDFDLLTCAKQKWSCVSSSLFFSGTGKPEEQHCRNLMQFISQREHALQSFGIYLIDLVFAGDEDLRNFIFGNCKRLICFRMDGWIFLTYSPKKHKLYLCDMTCESLQPILHLYPKTKSIEIRITSAAARRASRSFSTKWKEDIAAFTATKKSYAVMSEIIME